MKFRFVALGISAPVLLSTLILTGCHAYAKLYPIEGPLSKLSPPPLFNAKVAGGPITGYFSAVISDHENVSCKLTKYAWNKSSAYPGTFDIKHAWNAVYGDKFFEGHILGASTAYYWCDAKGDKGTTIHMAMQVDMAKDESRSQGVKGVVEDDKDNIYKVAF